VEREPVMGVWGLGPQWGPGAKPLVRGSGGPLKLKALLYFKAARMLFYGPISTKYTSVSRYTSDVRIFEILNRIE